MMGEGAPCVVPMSAADLDWVGAREAELHAFPWTRGNFEDSLAAGHGAWVMRLDTRPLGYAIMMMVLDEAHLLNLSIARQVQGQGYGRVLLDRLCAEARAGGATQLFLEVRPSNEAALALYRKAGFEQIGRRRGYYPAREGREDAIVMRLTL